MRWFVFRSGPLLSTGTASASSRNPLCWVFRPVLFPQESTVLRFKHHVSEGNTRRLLRESDDDETPQRAFFASEEAHREPAESVVYFLSSVLCQFIDFVSKQQSLSKGLNLKNLYSSSSFYIIIEMT